MIEQDIENKGKNNEKWLFSPSEISALFGHSITTFRKRVALPDFPKGCKAAHGKYDLRLYLKFIMARFPGNADGSKMDLAAAKLLREQKRAEKEEIIVAQMRGDLILREQAISDTSFVLSGLKNRFMGWWKSLPPHLVGQDEKAIGIVLKKEIWELLEDLSRGIESIIPKPQKTVKTKKTKGKTNG